MKPALFFQTLKKVLSDSNNINILRRDIIIEGVP